MQEEILSCIKKLNEIALKPCCLEDQEHYISVMISAEDDDKKEGYKERIKSLNDLK